MHQGGGRRRGLGWEQPEAEEDATVESQAKWSRMVDCFRFGVGLSSSDNNKRCGKVEGLSGRRFRVDRFLNDEILVLPSQS